MKTPIAVAMDVYAEYGGRLTVEQLMTKAIEADRAQRNANAERELQARELHHFEAEEALANILGIATKSHTQSWLADIREVAAVARKALGGPAE